MQFLFRQTRHIYRAIALHIICIMHETDPCLQHLECRKCPKIRHQGRFQAIYAHHISMYFAGGVAMMLKYNNLP